MTFIVVLYSSIRFWNESVMLSVRSYCGYSTNGLSEVRVYRRSKCGLQALQLPWCRNIESLKMQCKISKEQILFIQSHWCQNNVLINSFVTMNQFNVCEDLCNVLLKIPKSQLKLPKWSNYKIKIFENFPDKTF